MIRIFIFFILFISHSQAAQLPVKQTIVVPEIHQTMRPKHSYWRVGPNSTNTTEAGSYTRVQTLRDQSLLLDANTVRSPDNRKLFDHPIKLGRPYSVRPGSIPYGTGADLVTNVDFYVDCGTYNACLCQSSTGTPYCTDFTAITGIRFNASGTIPYLTTMPISVKFPLYGENGQLYELPVSLYIDPEDWRQLQIATVHDIADKNIDVGTTTGHFTATTTLRSSTHVLRATSPNTDLNLKLLTDEGWMPIPPGGIELVGTKGLFTTNVYTVQVAGQVKAAGVTVVPINIEGEYL